MNKIQIRVSRWVNRYKDFTFVATCIAVAISALALGVFALSGALWGPKVIRYLNNIKK